MIRPVRCKILLYNAFCNGGILLGFMNHDAKERNNNNNNINSNSNGNGTATLIKCKFRIEGREEKSNKPKQTNTKQALIHSNGQIHTVQRYRCECSDNS